VSAKDKLEEVAAALRARWQASASPEASQTNPLVGEDASAEGGPINAGSVVATPVPEAECENQATIPNQPFSPLAGLDLDTAIRLRWALRDVKAKRTKLTPVSPSDLKTLIAMGLVEIHDDAPMLTNEGHQALDQ
jgi:hypothetical protein